MSVEMCFYVPGSHNIIDGVRDDGTSSCFGETLDQIRQRYPGAVVGSYAEWVANKAAEQDSPVTWDEIDEERYWEMLEVLPPASMDGRKFLVGEPYDHHAATGQPRFTAFWMFGTARIVEVPQGGVVCALEQQANPGARFFQSNRPITIAEFKSPSLPRPLFA